MTATTIPRISALILLTTSLFLTFSQTSIAKFTINIITYFLPQFPYQNEILLATAFALFAAMVGAVYAIGGKSRTTLLTILCFPILLVTTIPYSFNNWNSDLTNPYVTGGLQFFFTIACGITVIFCLILLNLISKLEYTQKELATRGAQKSEIKTLTAGALSYILPITILSALFTIGALIAIMIARPLGAYVVELSPLMTLMFGIGSIATIAILTYYSLRQEN